MATHLIVGLGNPTEEYAGTRHNTGRMLVEVLHATHEFSEWKEDKKPAMQSAKGTIAGKKAILLQPNTFMNNSGRAVAHFIKSKKDAGNAIVVYDDMDLPLGVIKISHGRSSGGHNGVESIIKALKTKDFVRVRVGVSPAGAKGTARKPKGEEKVIKFLLGKFTSAEAQELKKIFKRVAEAVEVIIKDGYQAGMTAYN